ncbi:MAG: P1 family peptidase [Kangiellaceae bacterium]|jgi:D-aminopeptidase|nr:P1 family peptidase [Kangiellaceae bacterium]
MHKNYYYLALLFPLLTVCKSLSSEQVTARQLGITPGVLPTGKLNAITDVTGVKVGHLTIQQGKQFNTGVTAIIPADGNLRKNKVAAAVHVFNGYGKMAGISQVQELGEIETPIILTNTLNVAEGVAGLVEWTLAQPGNDDVYSVNAVVGETNDARLNDIRGRKVSKRDVITAINNAKAGPVEQGNVGAGTGTVAFGWKGGIGTSSRQLPKSLGGYTLGVLVQSNFGGVLQMDGKPVGERLQQFYLKNAVTNDDSADGSIMIVVATDAPLSDRNLYRLAERAIGGLAKTGASLTNGSGDYVVAFTTHSETRRPDVNKVNTTTALNNSQMSPLFQAVIEATEEAIYNSLLMAETVDGYNGKVHELPVDRVRSLFN